MPRSLPEVRWQARLTAALVVSSALAAAVLAARAHRTGTRDFGFLAWNLILAWVPYGAAVIASALHRHAPDRRGRLLVPAAVWLVFLPNAPYVLTDLVHLRSSNFVWWYDVVLVASFAWVGCMLAVASLRIIQAVVDDVAGPVAGWLVILVAAGLSAVGIYLGRILRWNSWDLLVHPRGVLGDVLAGLARPDAWAFTALFAAFLLTAYFVFYAASSAVTRQ